MVETELIEESEGVNIFEESKKKIPILCVVDGTFDSLFCAGELCKYETDTYTYDVNVILCYNFENRHIKNDSFKLDEKTIKKLITDNLKIDESKIITFKMEKGKEDDIDVLLDKCIDIAVEKNISAINISWTNERHLENVARYQPYILYKARELIHNKNPPININIMFPYVSMSQEFIVERSSRYLNLEGLKNMYPEIANKKKIIKL